MPPEVEPVGTGDQDDQVAAAVGGDHDRIVGKARTLGASSAGAVNMNTPGALASLRIAAATSPADAASGQPGGRRHQRMVDAGGPESVATSDRVARNVGADLHSALEYPATTVVLVEVLPVPPRPIQVNGSRDHTVAPVLATSRAQRAPSFACSSPGRVPGRGLLREG